VLGKSDYTAHAGVYTGGANAVYWVEIVAQRPDGLVVIRNITKGVKRKVPEVTEAIEPDLLYPLLRGRDVQRWRAEPSACILITHEPGMRLNAIPEEKMQEIYPHTWAYLKRFEDVLRERGGWEVKQAMKAGRPFYSMSEIGDYTFAPWKVVWREVSHTLDTAVAMPSDDKPAIADHTLITVECSSGPEAFYVSGLLNSAPSRMAVQAYIVLHPDPHILDHIRIPKYDPADPVHRALAEASQEAHEAAAQGDEPRLREIEDRVDSLAAKLWNLTDRELTAIRRHFLTEQTNERG